MNILLGSCGGLTGIYLAKQYKDNHTIIGIDSNSQSVGKFFVDTFITVPSFSQNEYLGIVIDIIKKYSIDVFIPSHSEEISIISKYREKIEHHISGKLIVCNDKIIQLFNNKPKAYAEVSKRGINCPRIITNEKDINQFPLLAKPITASGSRGIIKINTKAEYNLYSLYNELFICEYYNWDEYTVDCFFSLDSSLIGYYTRKRIKSIGGAVSITSSAIEVDVIKEIKTLEKEFSFVGPVNFQFFYNNGEKIFFDFNLRCASGGLPLSVHAGLNIPEMLLKESMGIRYNRNISIDSTKRTMYRYFEELFD